MPTPTMQDALKVMYVLALRISELCELKASDVDFQRGCIMITGKGGKVRPLAITDDISTELLAAVKRPFKLFNVTVRTFRNYVYMAAAKANIGYCHPHMVRHSRATHLMNNGTELHDIKAIMRHEDISSTLIYTHVSLDRMRQQMELPGKSIIAVTARVPFPVKLQKC